MFNPWPYGYYLALALPLKALPIYTGVHRIIGKTVVASPMVARSRNQRRDPGFTKGGAAWAYNGGMRAEGPGAEPQVDVKAGMKLPEAESLLSIFIQKRGQELRF